MNELVRLRSGFAVLLALLTMLSLGGCTRNDSAAAQKTGEKDTPVAPALDPSGGVEKPTPPASDSSEPTKNEGDALAKDDPKVDPPADLEPLPKLDPDVEEEVTYLIDSLRGAPAEIQVPIMEELALHGPAASAAVPLLIEILSIRDGGLWQRRVAATTLAACGKSGRKALPKLMEMLADKRVAPFIRKGVAEALAKLVEKTDTELGPALVAELGDPEFGIRENCSLALANLGPGSIDALSAAFHSPNPRIREFAARATSRLGREAFELLPDLIDVLDDDAWLVLYRTIHALERFGSYGYPAAEKLYPLLSHRQWQVRKRAIHALGKIDPKSKVLDEQLTRIAKTDSHKSVQMAARVVQAKIRGEPRPKLTPVTKPTGNPLEDAKRSSPTANEPKTTGEGK
jgi:HEAT repeat protein